MIKHRLLALITIVFAIVIFYQVILLKNYTDDCELGPFKTALAACLWVQKREDTLCLMEVLKTITRDGRLNIEKLVRMGKRATIHKEMEDAVELAIRTCGDKATSRLEPPDEASDLFIECWLFSDTIRLFKKAFCP